MVKIDTLFTYVQQTAEQLLPACRDTLAAEQEAWWLLEKVTGIKKIQLLAHTSSILTESQKKQLAEYINQRVAEHKPLQYILGSVPFCDLEILVEPPILIPRPETEEWVTWLIEQLEPVRTKPLRILDLCSGSGCIGLALAHAFPNATVIAIDNNPAAIMLAERNKAHNHIKNYSCLLSDLYEKLVDQEPFDLIVSNPPYLASHEFMLLDESVKRWEDKNALVAQHEGLEIYEKILSNIRVHLKKDRLIDKGLPVVVFELGIAQESIGSIVRSYGFLDCRFFDDLQGLRRWAVLYV